MKNDQLNEFYSKHIIAKMPSDTEIVSISRIIGSKRLVDDDTGAIAQNVGRLEGPSATICSLGRPVRAKHGRIVDAAAEILVGDPRAVIEADRRQACGKAKDN